jgi:hypothetical protein
VLVNPISFRLMFFLGLATLILIYAADVQDRELVRDLVRRLDGPLGGLVLGLLVGPWRVRGRDPGASPRPLAAAA